MKMPFYAKLAWSGIRKNRKLYLPYLLSSGGSVAMYYIIHSLSDTPLLGNTIKELLSLGKFIVAAFALLFLFYTNSFLIRRRYKEFGLYNVLGMDKRKIDRIVIWETVIVAAISIVSGTIFGIALSKLAELGLLRAIRVPINYNFPLSKSALWYTPMLFCGIFLLLLLKSLVMVRRKQPLELLRSEVMGEKPPKTNWITAVLGVLLLGVAYGMAVTIQSPISAVMLFFVAVLMVIVATYLLFMSGSVALCRILQKNKRYYYKKNHFVSISSMVYRMKRNGAGLASICILCTMVLVIIASTTSLFFGSNDAIQSRFPRNVEFSVEMQSVENFSDEKIASIRTEYEKVFAQHNFTPANVRESCYTSICGVLNGTAINPDADNATLADYSALRNLYFFSVSDYNRQMNTDYELKPGEALIYPIRCSYKHSTLSVGDVNLKINGTLDRFMPLSETSYIINPSYMIVIPDFETLLPLDKLTDSAGEPMLYHNYYYGYDTPVSDEEAIAIYNDQLNVFDTLGVSEEHPYGYSFSAGCLALEKEDFYSTYGGLFFLGIMLSVLFLFAAAMIIYYKQISEGYEDQSRFEIMRKVGMTKSDIKKSINSQVLTVFFAPLLFAGLHLAFAFPLIWKMLELFNLHNLKLVILVTVGAFIAFGLLYAVLYKLTAHAYYSIVSGDGEKA